jgi:hypothetical protein
MAQAFCDATARVRFFSANQGGLPSTLDASLDRLGCLLSVDGELFSCFLLVSNVRPGPDAVGEVPIVFLSPELAKSKLRPGSRILLQHASPFAEGEIIDLPWMSDYMVGTLKELSTSIQRLRKDLEDRGQRAWVMDLDTLIGNPSTDALSELRKWLLALPREGPFEDDAIRGRIDGAVRYIEMQLNAWPSTAVR